MGSTVKTPIARSAFSLAAKIARVTVYVAVVSAVIAAIALRSVYAAVREVAVDVGGELVKLGDALGPVNRVHVNGEAMNVASAVTELSVVEVLDRAEAECRAHAGGLAEDFARIPAEAHRALPPVIEGSAGIGVMREVRGTRGIVACLARDGAGGIAGIARGVREFLATGDLAPLGKLRYVVADRTADAGGNPRKTTHVVTAWSDGPLRVGAMFPKNGDAPGSDAIGAPRPEQARRLLTASVEGAPYGVRIYDVAQSSAGALAEIDRAMLGAGWAAVPGVAREVTRGAAYTRDGVDLLVAAEDDAHDAQADHAIVSLVEMPAR